MANADGLRCHHDNSHYGLGIIDRKYRRRGHGIVSPFFKWDYFEVVTRQAAL